MGKERWKRVKENPQYLISSWGRIFSLKIERLLTPSIDKARCNYYVRIHLDGRKQRVHWLVALNFKRKQYEALKLLYPDAKIQVDHDDRNTLNNNVTNVNFKTESQNKYHRHETDIISFGGKIYKGKRK